MSKDSALGVASLTIVVTAMMAALKVAGYITWPWWIVLLPLYVEPALALVENCSVPARIPGPSPALNPE